MSLPARLVNVLAAPGETFETVKNSAPSPANWLLPALLLILVSWVGAGLIFSQDTIQQQLTEIIDQGIEKQLQRQQMPADKAEQARQIGQKWGAILAKVSATAAPVVVGFVTPFFWGLLLWLLGAKAFKGGFTYMKAVEVAGLANMILVLDAIVRTLLILLRSNLYAAPSLMLLVKDFDPQNTIHGLLGVVNVMTFWLLAVRSIGLARLSRTSIVKAAICVFGIWIAYTGFFIALGMITKAVFSRAGAA